MSGWDKPGWNLVWHDEFTAGSVPRTSDWWYLFCWGDQNDPQNDPAFLQGDTRTAGIGGSVIDLQTITNGMLQLQATNSSCLYGGLTFPYSACNVRTKISQLYGYFEVRAKFAAGQGIFPAIWLMPPVYDPNVAWEIDVLEMLGNSPTTLYQNVHWGVFAEGHQQLQQLSTFDSSAAFHTYAVDWDSTRIIWYYDDVEVYRLTSAQIPIPNVPMQLLLDNEVGSDWGGFPDGTTPWPSNMLVEYVRIYSKTGQAGFFGPNALGGF